MKTREALAACSEKSRERREVERERGAVIPHPLPKAFLMAGREIFETNHQRERERESGLTKVIPEDLAGRVLAASPAHLLHQLVIQEELQVQDEDADQLEATLRDPMSPENQMFFPS